MLFRSGIVCLINPNKLQIQYTMPETNITYFSTPYQIYVEFDNYKGIRFKAKVKEYVEASPDGSGSKEQRKRKII